MSQGQLSDTERVAEQHARMANQSIDPCGDLLDKAKAAVCGPRRAVYGDPEHDLQTTGDLWATWLNRRYGLQLKLTGSDVSTMMILLKTARLANTPDHEDSWTDAAGYAATGYRCSVVQKRG
jgi:hypothetical protein